MKSRQKLFLVMLFAVALMLTPMSAAWADTSSGEMTASEQGYATVGDGQRIDTFKLDDKFTYKSLGNDSGKPTFTLNTSSIQNIVKNKLLPRWSGLAAGVFRDQAGQLVDLYGYKNNGGCMSKDGFDAYYDRARSVNGKYRDENWSCYSLTDKFKQTYPSRAGEQNWDQFVVSGVKQISSLSDARKMMGQAVRDTEKSNPLSVDEILGVDENGEDRLSSLDDDNPTIGFTNILTSINCKGSSKDYDYVSFGIAFYDFEPVPVAANNLDYVSVGASKETNNKGENSSEITNNQQQDIMHSALLGDSVTETTSTTLSGLASFNLQQNIGANIGMSNTDTSSSTSFWDDDTFGMGSETESSSESLSLGMDWGAAWEMGGAMGAEMGHSTSKEVSKAVETTISLPPHTATNTTQKTTTTTYTQNYQQPVILNYKVALFAVSGDFTGAAGGGINPGQYDKQSLVIMFDTKDDTDTSYGCAATDDLYSRVVTNKSVANYDSSNGRTFETHSTASGFTKSNGINWNDVESYADKHVKVEDLATTNYFYETPGKVSVEQDKTSSNVDELYPLYDLASVRTPKTNYVLYTNNTLNSDSFPLEGYNKYNVAFYGFNPKWGEWNRCDEEGNIINEGYLENDDPVELKGGELVPKENTTGGTVYMTWKFKEGEKAKTGEHTDGQVFADSDIETPVVKIQVVNIGLDDPKVTAEGSYKGFYKTPINLHNEFTYEVTDGDDKVLETQVYWESREPESSGIHVNSGTGDVKFTKPGTYKVRPYVLNNDKPKPKKVYSPWLTVTATEHDIMHYDKKDPTCADDGWKEHYRCTDCGKYFSDAEGNNVITEEDYIIKATGHDWGEWTTTKEPSGNEAGEQQRVCKNDKSHVDKRDLYSVQFNVNGRGTAPEKQNVPAGASVKVPQVPTATGYTFDGWFTDKACTEAYDFGETVDKNMVLYAKWTANSYTAAAMAVDLIPGESFVDENGEEQTEVKVAPTTNGSIKIEDGDVVTEEEGEGYTYSYKDVEYGKLVTLTVTPARGYGLKDIVAIPVKSDSSVGESFTPNKIGDNKYSFTMPDADVAILANFAQVTVTYDGNAPEGETATGVPEEEKIAYGGTPTKLDNEPSIEGYFFGGWFTDKDCTKPYLNSSALTEDTTLYAKWSKDETMHKVTYTLSWEPDPADPEGTDHYTESYKVEDGAEAYDPTEDLYELAGLDLLKAYKLHSEGDKCWFTDAEFNDPFDFTTPITEETRLYAKVVPREYKVTYYDGDTELGSQNVEYNKPIGTIADDVTEPEKPDHEYEWTTEDGAPWDIASTPVTDDLKLVAKWNVNQYKVSFDANGGSGNMDAKEVEENTDYELPESTFTAPEGKCDLEAWEVQVGTNDAEKKQPGDKVTITANTTVKAIWKDHKWGEWKETTPATIGAEGEEARECANDKEHAQKRSIDKVDPTPLNKAIKAGQDTQKGVKVSEDGKDVDPADLYTTAAEKKALEDAIAAAQKVVNNPKSTQKDVDDAVAAMNKAKETYDAAKKKGKKAKAVVPKRRSAKEVEKEILRSKSDKDHAGSKYAPLMLKSTKQTKKSVKLTWKKVKGAKKYVIYANACGKKNRYKKLKTLSAAKKIFNVTKVAGKKLKKKTYYKFIIVAIDKDNNVVSISMTVHAATKGSKKKANPKGVIVKAKVNKAGKKIKKWKNTSTITLKAGSAPKALVKSTKLKAKNKKAKKTRISNHIPIRFESSNTNVVTVNKKGKLTAKNKGKAKIYVIAQNGIAKTVKVTVK